MALFDTITKTHERDLFIRLLEIEVKRNPMAGLRKSLTPALDVFEAITGTKPVIEKAAS